MDPKLCVCHAAVYLKCYPSELNVKLARAVADLSLLTRITFDERVVESVVDAWIRQNGDDEAIYPG